MGMIASTDHELVEASRRGESEAFGKLVARYQDVVCAVSYSSTGDRALSEDVAQETFVAAWRRLDRVREGSLRAWLCAIARNLGHKARRRTWREQPMEADEQIAADNPFDDLARADSERIVRDALARIPEKYREVLVLFYRESQSVRDVAQTLGIGEAAVAQRLSRGRRYLADGMMELVETSLRGRPRRNLVAAVLATIVAIEIPSRVDAASLKTKGSTMMKFAIAASLLAAAGTTAYLVHDRTDAASATPVTAKAAAAPTLHYGTGVARRPALGPTAPVHATVARSKTVDDLAMLPSDADVVVGVDIARIRNSSLFKLVAPMLLSKAPGLGQLQSACALDPIAELSSITIGIKHMGSKRVADGAVVVHGLSKSKVFDCLTKLGSNADLHVDGDVMTFGGGSEQVALTFIDDTTALLVIGADATKDDIARVAARRGTVGSPSYSDLIHEINTDDALWLAVDESSPVLTEINKRIAEPTGVQFHGIYGSIDVGDGIVLNAGGRTGSPELVAKLVDLAQHQIDANQLAQRFEQLDVNADGSDVIVSIALSASQLMQIVSNHTAGQQP
jgi:RNA polymerase sigma factor (sigma-70 family)